MILINAYRNQLEETVINQGLRQGCGLSPTLFNIYSDFILRKWKCKVNKGIKMGNDEFLNVLLFADDIVIIQKNEGDLQISVYQLRKICMEYNLTMSNKKTKTMAFRGKYPVRSKIVLDHSTSEQVSRST